MGLYLSGNREIYMMMMMMILPALPGKHSFLRLAKKMDEWFYLYGFKINGLCI